MWALVPLELSSACQLDSMNSVITGGVFEIQEKNKQEADEQTKELDEGRIEGRVERESS